MSAVSSVKIGQTTVAIVNMGLLETPAPAIMLSANNKLEASPSRWNWSQEVEKRAGSAYREECAWLRQSAGPHGLTTGSAVVTGPGDLFQTGPLRWVVQAITVHYDKGGNRVLATPEIVYGAVRAGLEKAEIYRIGAVATYLMVIRSGFATAPDDEMAEALFRAILDHAAIASSVEQVSICETDPDRYQLAIRVLNKLVAYRVKARP